MRGARLPPRSLIGLLLLAGCGAADAPTPESLSMEQVVCPAAATVKGVDVSVYQGNINWTAAHNAGIDFAIARISDGTFLDTRFDQNWPAMKNAGLVRGAYQFFEPGVDPTTQANIVVQKVGVLGAGDLPVTADMEVTGGQAAGTIAANLQTWVNKVQAGTGKAPMIYTSPGFWSGSVASGAFVNLPLWVANWGVNCPNTPAPWGAFSVWQYSDMGSVNGIPAVVDLDLFDGDIAALRAFAGMSPAYAAQYVGQSFPLAATALPIAPGQTVPAWLEMKNVGTATWDTNTRLGTSSPRDRRSAFASPKWLSPSRAAAVSGTVPPGQSFRFQFDFQAPAATGTYFEYFNLVQEGVAWFSDAGQGGPRDDQIEAQIKVVQAQWAAQLVAQSFPAADSAALRMAVGDSVDGWFDLKNIGTATWKAGVTKLAPTPRDRSSPLADSKWLSPTRVSALAADVAPGAVGRFPARLHARAVGDVSQTFNLVEEAVAWFSDALPTAGGPPDDFVRVRVSVVPVPDGGAPGGDGGPPAGVALHGGCGCAIGAASPSLPTGLLVLGPPALLLFLRRRRASLRPCHPPIRAYISADGRPRASEGERAG